MVHLYASRFVVARSEFELKPHQIYMSCTISNLNICVLKNPSINTLVLEIKYHYSKLCVTSYLLTSRTLCIKISSHRCMSRWDPNLPIFSSIGTPEYLIYSTDSSKQKRLGNTDIGNRKYLVDRSYTVEETGALR